MMPMSPTMMFQSVGLLGGLFLPLIVLLLFAILVLPGVLHGSGKPHAIGKAAYNYLAASLGIVLMSAGGLPAVYAVFARQPLSTGSYTGLLLVFAVGGLTFLWHDARLEKSDSASKALPASLFFFTWKFIGLLVSLFAGLSFVLRIIARTDTGASDWWVIHLIMLLYGLLLSWFTINEEKQAIKPLAHAVPMKASKAKR